MFNNFKIQINSMHTLLNFNKDNWHVIFYLLVNIGLIFPLKYTIFLEHIFIGLPLSLGGFITFYYIENYLQKLDRLYEEHNLAHFFNRFTKSDKFLRLCKFLFFMMIIFFPLIIGYQIKNNPTLIEIFLYVCMSFLLVLCSINVIYYGYIKPNFQKRYVTYFILLVLFVFFILNYMFPNIFSFFLENFSNEFIDVVVITLTFILMTATLGLLAFTYSTVLNNCNTTKNKMKLIGVDYFKSTIFVIFFSFSLFLLFIILKFFNLDWSAQLNGNYNIILEINIVCISIFISTYFMIRFLEYFLKAAKNCLKEFDLI